jgi:hypothetical protein
MTVLAQAQEMLQKAYDALAKAYDSPQSYSVTSGGGSRSKSSVDITQLQDAIDYWEKKVNNLSRGGISIVGAIPVD